MPSSSPKRIWTRRNNSKTNSFQKMNEDSMFQNPCLADEWGRRGTLKTGEFHFLTLFPSSLYPISHEEHFSDNAFLLFSNNLLGKASSFSSLLTFRSSPDPELQSTVYSTSPFRHLISISKSMCLELDISSPPRPAPHLSEWQLHSPNWLDKNMSHP